ncbi:hypothetical protein AURDEDRAFT_170707 [Auricularia subglabra TFB-10046 SS5]|uniref:Uncharacterized protein n=1 Tax=Auricularia subglabra (strain TFB-10046 / SS5) TaxID=717982 RepID=J0D1T5_AURST|nr:hypothetical protein AURDEDRAFT_170707 [Auricularia subglabra TFB-10046 SS5]
MLTSREAAGLPQEDVFFRLPQLDEKQAHHLADLMQSLCAGPPPVQNDALSFSMEATAVNMGATIATTQPRILRVPNVSSDESNA